MVFFGLSTAVANTLYRSGNKNLCVFPAQLQAGAGPWGGSKVIYDLMPCVMDDFAKKRQHFIQHGIPLRTYLTFTQGGGREFSDFLSLHPNKSYKTSFYKKIYKMIKCYQDLFGHLCIFFKFLLFKLLKQ